MKTSAARILDKLGLTYDLLPYDVDPKDLAAERVAARIDAAVAASRLYQCSQWSHWGDRSR
jgi:hypothetical protein